MTDSCSDYNKLEDIFRESLLEISIDKSDKFHDVFADVIDEVVTLNAVDPLHKQLCYS